MTDRMKTVMINGVPYRMRGDMPFYVEMVEKDLREKEIQDAYDEGRGDGYEGLDKYL